MTKGEKVAKILEEEFYPLFERLKIARKRVLLNEGINEDLAELVSSTEFHFRKTMANKIGPNKALLAELRLIHTEQHRFIVQLTNEGVLPGLGSMSFDGGEMIL